MPKFCGECGHKFPDGGAPKFCGECGARVGGDEGISAPSRPKLPSSKPSRVVYAPTKKKAAPIRSDQGQMPWEKEKALKGKSDGKAVNSQEHNGHFGLTAEANKRMADKYSIGLEREVRAWVSRHVPSANWSNGFAEGLKSGVVLCGLVNDLRPGAIKGCKESKMAFVRMENIAKFIKACTTVMGLRSTDCFMTVDLYEEKNLTQVLQCLAALKTKCPR
jgi:hypothetical protein